MGGNQRLRRAVVGRADHDDSINALAASPVKDWQTAIVRKVLIAVSQIVTGNQPAHRMRNDVKRYWFVNSKPTLSFCLDVSSFLLHEFMKFLGVVRVVSTPIVWKLKAGVVLTSIVNCSGQPQLLIAITANAKHP